MSDLSGFTAVDPTPGPRRQGTQPDPELEALLSEYATNRNDPAPVGVAPVQPGDVFQAPPVAASNAAHLAEIPTGFTMPAVEQIVPGPAPVTFDALVSAEDTFAVPDLPEGFVVPDLAPVNPQTEPAATSWPEPLSFNEPQADEPILDDGRIPDPSEQQTPVADLFEVPAPTFEVPAPMFDSPASAVSAAPFEMPEWTSPAISASPGDSVFTMPEDATPWQAYEEVEQHSLVQALVVPPIAVPSVPVAADYAPFEVAAPSAAPAPAYDTAAQPPVFEEPASGPAEGWSPAPQQGTTTPAPPADLAAMLAAANAGAPVVPAASHFGVPQALPQQAPTTPQYDVPPAVKPVAAQPMFDIPAQPPVQPSSTHVQQFQVPPAVPQQVPAQVVPQLQQQQQQQQVAPPQFEVPTQMPAAPQFQAPPAAPAVPLPPPVTQVQPQAESALPTGFFDDDFDGPTPAPLTIAAEPAAVAVAPIPVVKQADVAPQAAPPAAAPAPTSAPVPTPAAPTEDDPSNRLVAEVARVEARIPLSAVGANLTVNEDWLNQVLRQLVALEISDVHLHMSGARGELLIEGRRDGFLEKIRLLKGREATMVLNLVKSGSRISTGSNRVPGDGRYQLEIDNYPYQLRAVVTPLFDGGEKVVLRLPQTGQLRPLESLGFTARNLEAVSNLLSIPGGMTVIAGPMGEGKTTTAHAALMRIGGAGKAVMSLEDPVERALFDVAQVEVNEDIGSGFAANMKYLVRSDFDTLFLGEIRDEATAAAAVRIAQAGRRVITTIHATNNVTALRKLIQMSDGSALSTLDAVRGVVSQRLVRRLGDGPDGYLGRHPVHEVLTVDSALSEAIVRDESIEAIELSAADTSTTFAENARALIAEGITDEREVRRVLGNVL